MRINKIRNLVIFLIICTITNLLKASPEASPVQIQCSNKYDVSNNSFDNFSVISEFPVLTHFDIAKFNSPYYYRYYFNVSEDLKQQLPTTHFRFEAKSNNSDEFCTTEKSIITRINLLKKNYFLFPIDTTEIRLILSHRENINNIDNVPRFIMPDTASTSNINITNNKIIWSVAKPCEHCKISYTCRNCKYLSMSSITEQGTIRINSSLQSFTLTNMTTTSCFIYLYKQNNADKTTYLIKKETFDNINLTYQIDENMPKIKFNDSNKILTLDFSNCILRPNELEYKFYFKCINDWCTEEKEFYLWYKYSTEQNFVEFPVAIQPFTKYNISIHFKVKNCTSFNDKWQQSYGVMTSLPGVPGIIGNFSYFHMNATHLWIRFQDPYPPTGIVFSYKISYSDPQMNTKDIRYTKSNYRCTEWQNFVCLIIKYTPNDVYIQAKNEDIKEFGPKFIFSVDTAIFNFRSNLNTPKIEFTANNKLSTFADCKLQPNELQSILYFKCINEWCEKEKEFSLCYNQNYNYFNEIYYLESNDKIQPFTEYNISINLKAKYLLFNDKWRKSYGVIRSLPAVPAIIRKFSHFYMNASHLWIRFQDPYPPTGNIISYHISYSGSLINNTNYTQPKSNYTCTKWQKFVCLIVKNTPKGYIYIQAKNKDVNQFGPKFNFSVDTTNFILGFRSNFTVNVNPTKSKLHLSWIPPYLQSGPFVTHFIVSKSASKHNNTRSIDNYSLINKTYNDSVEIHGQSQFQIKIEASNDHEKIQHILNIQITNFSKKFLLIKICNEEIVQCKLHIEIAKNTNQSTINFVIENNMKNESEYEKDILIKKIDRIKKKINFAVEPNNFLEMNMDSINKTNFLFLLYKLNGRQQYEVYNIRYNKTETILLKNEKNTYTHLWLIVVVIVGVVIIFSVLGFLFYRYKKKHMNLFENYENNNFNLSVQLSKLLNHKHDNNFNSNAIEVKNFENYIKKVLENESQALNKEYDTIPKDFGEKQKMIGSRLENKTKNRFKNILPYDDKIVNLSNGNYINASFTNGFQMPNAYIATQAPLKTTINDLWQMIWEQKVTTIIMLTQLKEDNKVKSEKYWPNWRQSETYGDIYVTNVKENIFSDYILNSLKVIFNNETRIVEHFQYVTWPDHKIPLYQDGFTAFMREVITQNSPMVVHCNAGCGRTGTFIMCHIILKMAESIKIVDFLKVLHQLRESRVNMVNNSDQYIFAHLVVYQYLFEKNFAFPVNSSFSSDIEIIGNKTIQSVREHLNKFLDLYQKRLPKSNINICEEDSVKNRFPNILPLNHSRMFLIPSAEFESNYINAISVDCYRASKKFIVTQQPLVNTVEDFWRLVKDNEIQTIVSLNEIVNNEDTPTFWPNYNSSMTFSARLGKAENVSFEDEGIYEFNKIKVFNNYVHIYQLKDWQKNTNLPKSTSHIIALWKEIWNKRTNPGIIVTCYDGTTASGLFVALSYLLERINVEQICDVYSAVKTVKQSRFEFVATEEQILFLYKAAKDYVADFNEYGNFKS